MKTTVNLEFNSPQEASAFLAQIGGGQAGVVAAALAPQQPGTGYAPPAPPPNYPPPVGVQQPVYTPPQQPMAPQPQPQPQMVPQPGAPTITAAQVAAAAQAFAKAYGPPAAKAKLAELGAKSVGAIPPQLFPQAMATFAIAA